MTEKPTVHKEPVSSQHPDEHQHNREGEGQELGQSETPTTAEWYPAINKKNAGDQGCYEVISTDFNRLIDFSYSEA